VKNVRCRKRQWNRDRSARSRAPLQEGPGKLRVRRGGIEPHLWSLAAPTDGLRAWLYTHPLQRSVERLSDLRNDEFRAQPDVPDRKAQDHPAAKTHPVLPGQILLERIKPAVAIEPIDLDDEEGEGPREIRPCH
jgi:hypothetical protein